MVMKKFKSIALYFQSYMYLGQSEEPKKRLFLSYLFT